MVDVVTRIGCSRAKMAVGLLMGCLLLLAATAPPAGSGPRRAAGTLDLRATLAVVSLPVGCPAGLPPDADCRARTEKGLVPGLGSVTATYIWSFSMTSPDCPPDRGKPLATSGRLVVAGKGEILFAVAQGGRCVAQEPIRNEPQEFTITGGTGPYGGASGSGSLERRIGGGIGTETLTGTLVVSGLEFDVTPPTLTGATSKTVRAPKGAKRVRVTYNVTASDAVDGAVPATCQPRSGARFPLGRTTVRCEATDKSGNARRATFVVTVKGR